MDEIEKLLKLWQKSYYFEALEMLIIGNMRIVGNIIKEYRYCGLSNDDLISIGTEGLIKGINGFDLNKGIKAFNSYVGTAIHNQIRMELNNEKKHSDVLSLNRVLSYDEYGGEATGEDIIGTDEEELINNVMSKMRSNAIRDALMILTPRERQVILLRYGLDSGCCQTLESIANIYKCSPSNITKIQQKALTKLRCHKKTKNLKDFI